MNNIILGCGGQDGQVLTELLLSQGEKVYGVVRRSSQPRRYLNRLVENGLVLVEGDMTDLSSLQNIFSAYKPDRIFAIGAMSHVGISFTEPLSTWDITAKGILNTLEAMRRICPNAKMYNAASSEMFGSNYSITEDYDAYSTIGHYNFKKHGDMSCEFYIDYMERHYKHEYNTYIPYQSEETPMMGNSPYGIAKLAAFHATRLYRESYGLWAASGILFNHESKYRSINFVTRKITNYVSRVLLSKKVGTSIPKLKLGNLSAKRDWSDARDMTKAMTYILNADKPDDYVCGSGETHSVEEFAKIAFEYIGENYENHIETDVDLMRPCEVEYLRANPTKIKKELGWSPEISFTQMIHDMINNDIERTEMIYKNHGDV